MEHIRSVIKIFFSLRGSLILCTRSIVPVFHNLHLNLVYNGLISKTYVVMIQYSGLG